MKNHHIKSVEFKNDSLIIYLNHQTLSVKISEVPEKLHNATDKDRNDFVISPSGYGIHWTQIDEDLSVDGIIRKASKNN
jgi:hypothetical protein